MATCTLQVLPSVENRCWSAPTASANSCIAVGSTCQEWWRLSMPLSIPRSARNAAQAGLPRRVGDDRPRSPRGARGCRRAGGSGRGTPRWPPRSARRRGRSAPDLGRPPPEPSARCARGGHRRPCPPTTDFRRRSILTARGCDGPAGRVTDGVRIVITGASGNVGTALLRRLAGRPRVVGCLPAAPRPAPPTARRLAPLDLADPAAERDVCGRRARRRRRRALAWGSNRRTTSVPGAGRRRRHRAPSSGRAAAGVPHLLHMSSLGAYSPGPDGRRGRESWPTEASPRSPYSRDKVAAERLSTRTSSTAPTARRWRRMRPGLIVQRDAAARCCATASAFLPAGVLRHLPLLPVDRSWSCPSCTPTTSPTPPRVCSTGGRPGRSTSPPIRR